jgi:hypothetical protein
MSFHLHLSSDKGFFSEKSMLLDCLIDLSSLMGFGLTAVAVRPETPRTQKQERRREFYLPPPLAF